jgi:hypothetical protein
LKELSRAGFTKLVNGRMVSCHDKTVLVRCKNCDKLFAYTRLLCFRRGFKTVSPNKFVTGNEIVLVFKIGF